MSLLPKINIVLKSCLSKNAFSFFTHNDFDPGNDEWTSKPSLPCFLRFHCLAKDGGGSHLLPVGCRQEGPLGNFLFKLRYSLSSSSPKLQLHLWHNFAKIKSQYHFYQSFRSQDVFWGTFWNFAEKTNWWFWYASNLLAWHWVRTSPTSSNKNEKAIHKTYCVFSLFWGYSSD